MSNLNERQFGTTTVQKGKQVIPAKMPGETQHYIARPLGQGFQRTDVGHSQQHPFSRANQMLLASEERKLARKKGK